MHQSSASSDQNAIETAARCTISTMGGGSQNGHGILHLISKLLLLVIISGLFTMLLIGIVIIRVLSDKLTHWPQTIQSVSFALDIFASMFAVYAQFGFGQWIYKALCWQFHLPIFNKCADELPGSSVDANL